MRNRKYFPVSVLLMLFTCWCSIAHAQTNPTDSLPGDPGAFTISVTKVQDMCFGAFSITGTGGTIILSNTGVRTATGGITLLSLSYAYYQAMFDIDAPQNTIISVTNGADAILSGSNGGTMTLKLGSCNPGSPFTTTAMPPARTSISIGGTLTVSTTGSSPPGQYSGTFDVYINYQ